MKQISRYTFILSIIFLFLMGSPSDCIAQIGVPCDYQDPDIPCPIDGGVTVLLAVGIGYGIKKYKERAQPAKTPESIITK